MGTRGRGGDSPQESLGPKRAGEGRGGGDRNENIAEARGGETESEARGEGGERGRRVEGPVMKGGGGGRGGEEGAPVLEIEGFLHAVPVMHINVHVQNTCMVLEQLQNRQHQVVDIAETCHPALPGAWSLITPPSMSRTWLARQHLPS